MKKSSMTEILRAAIVDSELTGAELARRSGIAQPVICRFARGSRDLTLRTADKLARCLGLAFGKFPGP